jgi:hypothetical protein
MNYMALNMAAGDAMLTEFYSNLGEARKRQLSDDYLDTGEFDFMQSFSNEIENIRAEAQDESEDCLSVVNSSFSDIFHVQHVRFRAHSFKARGVPV